MQNIIFGHQNGKKYSKNWPKNPQNLDFIITWSIFIIQCTLNPISNSFHRLINHKKQLIVKNKFWPSKWPKISENWPKIHKI
jgi:hypothetical protein